MTGRDILLVEDDEGVRMGVRYALEMDGWQVLEAESVAEARELFERRNFALALLDIGLPDGSGLDLCRWMRERSSLPILFLTARDAEVDKVLGLELGGDDYITKPFSTRELCARVRAMYRRAYDIRDSQGGPIRRGDLLISFEERKILKGGEPISLTHTEFEILRFMATRPGKVFTREELLQQIWDVSFVGGAKTIDVHIHNMRSKLDPAPDGASYIETVRGAGYKWRVGE